jgi:hypothetical protein
MNRNEMADSEIEVELDLPPLRYKIGIEDPKKADKAVRTLKSFINTNDVKFVQAANEAIENRQRTIAKLAEKQPFVCRLPHWFFKANPSVPEAMALILYFANRPLTMVQITRLVNLELQGEKKDLRNISRHITSKGWVLYGYTIPNKVTQTYELNKPGKKWIEDKLIPKLTERAEKKLNNAKKIG